MSADACLFTKGDIVTQWNGKKVAGMSFEAVCKMMMEAEEQSLHSEEETEARVELTRLVP